jgi:hypothetical protein
VAITVKLDGQCRVIDVSSLSMLHCGCDCLEDAAVEPDVVGARTEWDPIQIHRYVARGSHCVESSRDARADVRGERFDSRLDALRTNGHRGRAAVRAEWRLITATHNLLKLHRHAAAAA